MSSNRANNHGLSRLSATAMLALTLMLVYAALSGGRPELASAQGCLGSSQLSGIQSCLSTGCTSVSVACSSGNGLGSCGSTASLGQSCGSFGAGNFGGGRSCVGIILQAGQSCSNGVVGCSPSQATGQGVPCSSGGTTASTSSTYCAATRTYVAPQLCASGSTLTTSGNRPMSCPGGGWASTPQGCYATGSTQSTAACASLGAQVSASPQCTAAGSYASTTSLQSGFSLSLPSGWNIIAGPAGTTLPGVSGSLFTFQPGDTSYEMLAAGAPLTAGVGYWIDLGSATTTSIATASPGTATVQLPAGQFVMIGNPGNTAATVTGADTVLTYNPSTTSYSQVTQLQPGQGAWAMSSVGGQAIITNGTAGQAAAGADAS